MLQLFHNQLRKEGRLLYHPALIESLLVAVDLKSDMGEANTLFKGQHVIVSTM
jgi:hypothetical protein